MRDEGQAGQDGLSIEGDSFVVLVNAEGQHSIWPSAKALPDGWTEAAPAASKAECVAFIEANWTDMRPQSLRAAMDGGTSKPK
jgi:MbtH protein